METDQVSASEDNGTSSTWKYLFYDLADHRTDDWFLMNNPIPMLLIVISYLYFIKVCGPKYMKDKKPYQLKNILMVYNIMQIIYNVWLFREIQFCIVFLHNMQLLYFDCGYPKYTVYLSLPNAIFFYYLFNDFYQKAYTKPHDQQIKGCEGSVKNR